MPFNETDPVKTVCLVVQIGRTCDTSVKNRTGRNSGLIVTQLLMRRPAWQRALKNFWAHSKDTAGACPMQTKSESQSPWKSTFSRRTTDFTFRPPEWPQ